MMELRNTHAANDPRITGFYLTTDVYIYKTTKND